MVVATVSKAYDNTLTSEGALKIVNIAAAIGGVTYTPTNNTGKTIKILAAYNNTSGSAVVATVSSGVITISSVALTNGDEISLVYTLV